MNWHKYWNYYSYLKFCNLHSQDKFVSFETSIDLFLKEFFYIKEIKSISTEIKRPSFIEIYITLSTEARIAKLPKWLYALAYYANKHKPETYAMLRLNFIGPTSTSFMDRCEREGFIYAKD